MAPGPDKTLRPNGAKTDDDAVADLKINRWEWLSDEDTARVLKQLQSDELSIEGSDLRPTTGARSEPADAEPGPARASTGNDARGGRGFNPYDNPGPHRPPKPRRR